MIWDNAYMRWLGKKKQECIQDMALACQGCPKEFGNIYTTLVKMQFADKPDYDYFIACQKDVMARKNFREESPLDWEPQNELAKMTQVVPNATMMHNENRKRSY
uniref:Uncharacterized protein n=1 Tax=Romanomermis culicivorax TaxID=13658 RepID=A0A915K7W9_ROMCU